MCVIYKTHAGMATKYFESIKILNKYLNSFYINTSKYKRMEIQLSNTFRYECINKYPCHTLILHFIRPLCT